MKRGDWITIEFATDQRITGQVVSTDRGISGIEHARIKIKKSEGLMPEPGRSILIYNWHEEKPKFVK